MNRKPGYPPEVRERAVHLVTTVTGVGMIWIVENAMGSYKNNVDYSEERLSMVKIMACLNWIRALAVIFALAIAFVSVVVNLKLDWEEECVPVWAELVFEFYLVMTLLQFNTDDSESDRMRTGHVVKKTVNFIFHFLGGAYSKLGSPK